MANAKALLILACLIAAQLLMPQRALSLEQWLREDLIARGCLPRNALQTDFECPTQGSYNICHWGLNRPRGIDLTCIANTWNRHTVERAYSAAPRNYSVSFGANAMVEVTRNHRGQGVVRRSGTYRVLTSIPNIGAIPRAQCDRSCALTDCRRHLNRVEILSLTVQGEHGGSWSISRSPDQNLLDGLRITGRMTPELDHFNMAYDACERRQAWGQRTQINMLHRVAGLFYFNNPVTSNVTPHSCHVDDVDYRVAPILDVNVPLSIVCR